MATRASDTFLVYISLQLFIDNTMKLQLISEVFDKPSLDGVEVSDISSRWETGFMYEFAVGDGIYTVRVVDYSPQEDTEIYQYLASVHIDDSESRKNAINSLLKYPVATVDLQWRLKDEPESAGTYSPSGLGNEFIIYSKLIACVSHYVENFEPIGFQFSGYTEDMDLVYDKLMKFTSKWMKYKFIRITSDSYIRSDIADMIPTFEKDTAEERELALGRLKDIRRYKNEQRRLKQ